MGFDNGVKAAIRRDDEDEFDYIYHLPHADLNRIIIRDPFLTKRKADDKMNSKCHLPIATKYSTQDLHSMMNSENLQLPRRRTLNVNRRHASISQLSANMNPSNNSLNFGKLKLETLNVKQDNHRYDHYRLELPFIRNRIYHVLGTR